MAFDSLGNCAKYIVSDGGIHNTSASTSTCGDSWSLTGGGLAGYEALQIYQMTGEVHPTGTDLYFGTQDNHLWASGDNGATWGPPAGNEGFFIQVPHDSPSASGQTVTYVTPGGANSNNYSGALFSAPQQWQDPLPGPSTGNPLLITPWKWTQWAQTATPDTGGRSLYLQSTQPPTFTWSSVPLTGPSPVVSGGQLFNLSYFPQVSGPSSDPTLFQAVTIGGSNGLVKIRGFLSGSGVVTNISAGINSIDGGCKIGEGTFLCPLAWAVDPNDPLHLIVADGGAQTMLQTRDGGNTWTPEPQLTNLVTQGGRFGFAEEVHAIAFDPADGHHILIGTEAAGIIASLDGGYTWAQEIGSDRATAITSFFFDEVQHDILFSTYGRGLWKLHLPSSDLSITDNSHPSPAIAGQALYYDVSATNGGPDAAPRVTVTDNLPPQVSYVTNNLPDPSVCSVNSPPPGTGQTLTCVLGDMASGAIVPFTIKTLVNSNAVVNTGPVSITSTASVASPGATDPNFANNSATATTIVNDSADLAVTQSCDANVLAGQTGNCTIYVDNHGPSDARNVVLTDKATSNGTFTMSSATPSQGSCGAPPPAGTIAQVQCNLGNLAAASATNTGRATVVIRYTATEGQTITEVASVTSDTPDPDTTNNQTSASLPVTSMSDLQITGITANPSSVVAGTALTYTVTVTNAGPSTATNVIVADTLPAGVTVTSVSAPGANACTAGVPGDSTQPTTCGFDLLSPSSSKTVTIVTQVKPSTTGILHNDARTSSATFDPNDSNNLAHIDTSVSVQSDLSTQIVPTPNQVVAGTALSYQITVTNNGPSTATGVTLTDPLPAVLTLTGTSVSGGTGSCGLQTNTNTVQCQLPNLDPGQNAVVFISTNTSPSTSPSPPALANTATAQSASPDPNMANNSATANVTVVTRADLGIVLTSDNSTYHPSSTIHYTVTVSNGGPSDAQQVVVTQQLPPPKTGSFVSTNISGCTLSGSTLTCSLGTIRAGGMVSYQVNFFIQGNKGMITSTASVASATSDPTATNNTSTRNVTVK